jgi:hypothetical protein
LPTLRVTGEGEVVRIWYYLPGLIWTYPGGPSGRGRCAGPPDPGYRREELFLYEALLDAGAIQDDTGHWLLAELTWSELVEGANPAAEGTRVWQHWESGTEDSLAELLFMGSLSARERVRLTGPSRTIESEDSEPFRAEVIPSGRQAEAYRWEARAPAGAGILSEVVFESPDAAETRVLRSPWFAFPDSRWVSDTLEESTWDVQVFVTLDGVEHRSEPHHWTVEVIASGEVGYFPLHEGAETIEIEQRDDGLWYVTGPGNFRRKTEMDTVHFDTPEGSAFRAKVEAHERHHIRQYMEPGGRGRRLWDAETFFQDSLLVLPGQPEAWEQRLEVNRRIRSWSRRDVRSYELDTCPTEFEAFEVAYQVEPRYLEWAPDDVAQVYVCSFPATEGGGG